VKRAECISNIGKFVFHIEQFGDGSAQINTGLITHLMLNDEDENKPKSVMVHLSSYNCLVSNIGIYSSRYEAEWLCRFYGLDVIS